MNIKLFLMVALGVTLVLSFGAPTVTAHPDRGCSGCHVPHGGDGDNSTVPLWNPQHTTTTLTGGYSNPNNTFNATITGPTGSSKLCLSCHDGSYAPVHADHRFDGAAGSLGTLTNSHPISFAYDAALAAADGELVDPSTLPADVLDGNQQMQCTSCHEVHNTASRQKTANLRWAYPVDTGDPATTVSDTYVNGQGLTYVFCTKCHVK